MRQLTRYAIQLTVILVCTLAFVSCDMDDNVPGGDVRLTGSWTLTGDAYGQLPESADCEFTFNPNGSGLYSCYDSYGDWTTYPVTWWADGEYLTIDVQWDTWNYTYTVTGGWLYLYPTNGDPYLVFAAY